MQGVCFVVKLECDDCKAIEIIDVPLEDVVVGEGGTIKIESQVYVNSGYAVKDGFYGEILWCEKCLERKDY
ncbi:MAG: hypothetical protein ACYSW0_16075 [Planctomycetota bacterium]